MKRYFVLFFTFLHTGLFAHNAEEILYEFDLNKDLSTLMIHLTTIGAIDVLKVQNPATYKDQTVFDFKLCEKDLEAYFNTHLKLQLGTNTFSLRLISYDLASHDALLVFEVVGSTRTYNGLQIQNTAFTNVYKNATNSMVIYYEGEKITLNATGEMQSVVFSVKKHLPNKQASVPKITASSIAVVVMVLACVGVAWLLKGNVMPKR